MRHGVAEERRPGLEESDRALTEKGHRKLAAQAEALRRLGWSADVVLTSPMRRAAETAQVVADVYSRAADPVGALTSGANPESYLAILAVQPPEAHVWIVTHEPDLSGAIRMLTGGAVRMRKGTIAVLDLDVPAQGGAVLRGLYDPDDMAALAGTAAPRVPKVKAKTAPEDASAEGDSPDAKKPAGKGNALLDMPATKGQRRAKPR